MANDPDYGARASKGASMASFFENPMFQEAMEQVHGSLFKAWCDTPSGEAGREAREEMHRIYVAATTLDHVFKAYIEDGETAVAEIRRLTERRNRTEGELYHA